MSRQLESQHLLGTIAAIEQNIAQGDLRISDQLDRIDQMSAAGHDTQQYKELLDVYLAVRDSRYQYRKRLLGRLYGK
jgi:hypothetical protein